MVYDFVTRFYPNLGRMYETAPNIQSVVVWLRYLMTQKSFHIKCGFLTHFSCGNYVFICYCDATWPVPTYVYSKKTDL